MAPKRPHPSLQPKKRARYQIPGEETETYGGMSMENPAMTGEQEDVPQDQPTTIDAEEEVQVTEQSAPTQPQHLVPQSTVTSKQLAEDNSVTISQQEIYGDLTDENSLVRASQSPKANKPRKTGPL